MEFSLQVALSSLAVFFLSVYLMKIVSAVKETMSVAKENVDGLEQHEEGSCLEGIAYSVILMINCFSFFLFFFYFLKYIW